MKVAILGGTRGLGAALANEVRQRNLQPIIIGSSVVDHEENGTIYRCCDLSNELSVQQFIKKLDSLGPVDWFFWNAAAFLEGEFGDVRTRDMLRVIDVNFRNSLLLTHGVWRNFISSRNPKYFTVIASTSGVRPRAGESVYVATKYAQVGFTRSLGLENPSPLIKVSLFLPGAMRTDLWKERVIPSSYSFFDPSKVARYMINQVLAQQDLFHEELIERNEHPELMEDK